MLTIRGSHIQSQKAQNSVTAMARGGQRAGDDSDGGNGHSTCPSEGGADVLLLQPFMASLAEPGHPTFSIKARKLDFSM